MLCLSYYNSGGELTLSGLDLTTVDCPFDPNEEFGAIMSLE